MFCGGEDLRCGMYSIPCMCPASTSQSRLSMRIQNTISGQCWLYQCRGKRYHVMQLPNDGVMLEACIFYFFASSSSLTSHHLYMT